MNTSPSMSLNPRKPVIRVIPITTWEPGNMLYDFWQKRLVKSKNRQNG